MRILLIIFLLTLFIGCNVQPETVADSSKPIQNQSATSKEDETSRPIYDIDFRNFTYPWTEKSGDSGKSFTLKNGKFTEPEGRFLSLESVNYQEGDKTLVTIIIEDGNAAYHILYIFDLDENTKPKLVQSFEFYETNEALATAFIAHGELIIEKYITGASDAQCCPSVIERQHYEWKEGKFVLAGTQKISNHYLKRSRRFGH